jgi:hypothetical protein
LLHNETMGKPEHERPQSTDMADVTKIDPAPAHGHGHGHVTGPGHATAGPSEDDRFGSGPVARDAHARVIGVSVHDGRTRLALASGAAQGVHLGMEGYVIDAAGAMHPVEIADVQERVTYAYVHLTVEEAYGLSAAVINPSSMPQTASKKDVHARIIGNSIENGMTKIMIASGPQQGVQAGAKGYLVGPDGKSYEDFEIVSAEGRVSVAYVKATLDMIHSFGSQVVINPSK